ncbi:MAG: hypothetical protein MMC23_003298 [Stictis urceolatum]|nr:hypothetical protein [Stictis urceolata]
MSTLEERARIISPIVPEAVAHNARVLSQIRSLTASLFGIAAGILGLESLEGFIFYFFGSMVVSELVISMRSGGQPEKYFVGPAAEGKAGQVGGLRDRVGVYSADVVSGLSSFVLTWTGVYGLVRS